MVANESAEVQRLTALAERYQQARLKSEQEKQQNEVHVDNATR